MNQQIKSKIDSVINVQKMGGFTLNIPTSGFLEKCNLKHWNYKVLVWNKSAGAEKWHFL